MRRVAAEPTLEYAAARYANLGIPVFPCAPGGKTPLTSNGFHAATTSAGRVRDWWQRNPDANIGIPTGAVSGVVVVDVDVHSGASGYNAFERARNASLANGWSWLVRTPSGGLHAYYPAAPRIEQRSWQVPAAHIDFRGDGGYVIAPPSRLMVNDLPTTYAVIAAANHSPRPVDALELRRFLEPPRRVAPRSELPPIGARVDKLAAWVASRPEGGCNGGLFWAACRMVEHGHDHSETLAVLSDAAQTAGLSEREIETTIESAYQSASRTSGRLTASRLGPTQPTEVIGL